MAKRDPMTQIYLGPEHRSGRDRRQRSSFLAPGYWGLWGRRRIVRRTSDQQRMHVDHYPAHLVVLVISIFLLAQFDTVLTLRMVGTGQFIEANPLMRALLEQDVQYFVNVRSLLWSLALVLLVALARYPKIWKIRPTRVIASLGIVYFALAAVMFSMLVAWG